jgi:hypothetical protein
MLGEHKTLVKVSLFLVPFNKILKLDLFECTEY